MTGRHRRKPYYVFISHTHNYPNQYYDLLYALESVEGFLFEDRSIPPDSPVHSQNPTVIKREINNRLRFSSVVLVIGGKFAAKRPWIQYELEKARAWTRKVIVVRQRKQREIPSEIVAFNDRIVEWDGQEIVDAIRELVP